MKYPELHARDNVAALLCVRHLHGTSRSCSPSWQHLQQLAENDAFYGGICKVLSHLLTFPFQSMILYSWYCWMYAINVVIYVISSSEFRKVYRIFFEDVVAGFLTVWGKCCFLRTSKTSTSEVELKHYSVRKESLHWRHLLACPNFLSQRSNTKKIWRRTMFRLESLLEGEVKPIQKWWLKCFNQTKVNSIISYI